MKHNLLIVFFITIANIVFAQEEVVVQRKSNEIAVNLLSTSRSDGRYYFPEIRYTRSFTDKLAWRFTIGARKFSEKTDTNVTNLRNDIIINESLTEGIVKLGGIGMVYEKKNFRCMSGATCFSFWGQLNLIILIG